MIALKFPQRPGGYALRVWPGGLDQRPVFLYMYMKYLCPRAGRSASSLADFYYTNTCSQAALVKLVQSI